MTENETQIDTYVLDICQLFDKDSDETGYANDIIDIVKALGVMLTDENVKIIDEFQSEVGNSEKIPFKDVFSLYERLSVNKKDKEEEEKELTNAFEFFDSENKGLIDVDYFKKAITSFGNKLTEEEINDLLTMATFDKSNKKFKYKDFIKNVLETK